MSTAKNGVSEEFDAIYDVADLLCAAYRGSDYRFGELHFAEPMGDGDYPDCLEDPPEFLRSGWTHYHEISMVLHPAKGALLLRMADPFDESDPESLTWAIAETHKELTTLQWKLERRLEQIGFWKDRPIVLGIAVVTTYPCPDEVRPAHISETMLIDRPKLPQFATHIDALFAHYTRDEAKPVTAWGQRLIDDITNSPDFLGGFVDEQQLLEFYDEFGSGLDNIVENVA